jgi:hypothetical protein
LPGIVLSSGNGLNPRLLDLRNSPHNTRSQLQLACIDGVCRDFLSLGQRQKIKQTKGQNTCELSIGDAGHALDADAGIQDTPSLRCSSRIGYTLGEQRLKRRTVQQHDAYGIRLRQGLFEQGVNAGTRVLAHDIGGAQGDCITDKWLGRPIDGLNGLGRRHAGATR